MSLSPVTGRTRVVVASIVGMALGVTLSAVAAESAILERVHSGTTTVNNSTTATSVPLDLPDATKAFVVCTARTTSDNSNKRVTCELGTDSLSIKADAAPGNNVMVVSWYVAEFESGVSVQRGVTTLAGAATSAVVSLAAPAMDCTKTFVVLAGERTAAGNATNNDERFTFQAVLGAAGTPCTAGTTSTVTLTRLEGGTTAAVAWQVVTMEGAFVQRGTTCIGAASTCPGSNGQTTTITPLASGVDTSKSFLLVTRTANTGVNGEEGLYFTRGDFSAAGASVTGLTFSRRTSSTAGNDRLDIGWEVVQLNDGSSVQRPPAPIALTDAANGPGSIGLDTLTTAPVDRTTAVPFVTMSGATGTGAALLADWSTAVSFNSDAQLAFTRGSNARDVTLSGFLVSFYRCANSPLCHVGVSSGAGRTTVAWSPIYDVACDALTPNTCHALVLRSTSTVTAVPANGTAYAVGASIGAATVVHNGAGAAAVQTFTETGLTNGATYFYRVFPKTAADQYVTALDAGVGEVAAKPQSGAVVWNYVATGGAALNAPIAGNDRVYIGSNGNRITALASDDGTEVATPTHTNGGVQGYVSWWIPVAGSANGEGVVAGDQLGFLTALNGATAGRAWTVDLGTDSIQAPVTVGVRDTNFSDAAFDAAYDADVVFAGTRNADQTVNSVIAVNGSDGAVLWAVSGVPAMDRVLGQPFIDYTRNRLWVSTGSGAGVFANQNSLWVLDIANQGAVLNAFTLGQLNGAPTMSYDATTVYVGAADGVLYAVDADSLVVRWSSTIAVGSPINGFVWEDFDVAGRLYFVTAAGGLYCVEDQGASAVSCGDGSIPAARRWSANPRIPVAGGSIAQPLIGDSQAPYIWVGGSDGRIHQLVLATGAADRTLVLEPGATIGDISTDGDQRLYVGSSQGRVYRIDLTGWSLP